jgi:hypothetical protein
MVGQFSTRIFPSRSGSGTFGRKSQPTRLPSRRHRRDLRSTGEPSRAGGSGALVSRPSHTRPVCRRQATPSSTGGFPSKNFIAFRRRARRRSRPRSARSGRVIAIGTSVVRALESAANADGTVRAGEGRASARIARSAPLRAVDAILTGVHQRGESHYELLRAFADDKVLDRVHAAVDERGYRAHEFGDSLLIKRHAPKLSFGVGSNADRRGNALNCLRKKGSNSEADSHDGHRRGSSQAHHGRLGRAEDRPGDHGLPSQQRGRNRPGGSHPQATARTPCRS